MRALLFRIFVSLLAVVALSSFRMAEQKRAPETHLLYDVRAAFVTAKPDVSKELVSETNRLVEQAIRATFRQVSLPRTILTIRISRTVKLPLLVGARYSAEISVDATAVGNGEKIAAGTFSVSTFALNHQHADHVLADRICDRIVSEFRLQDNGPSSLATALFP